MPALPSPSAPPLASVETVSWPTAFWALFALALNTAVQDPGIPIQPKLIEIEYPQPYSLAPMPLAVLTPLHGRLLRLSPIFCLVDTVHVAVSVLVAVVYHKLSLLQAICVVARRKRLHKADREDDYTDIGLPAAASNKVERGTSQILPPRRQFLPPSQFLSPPSQFPSPPSQFPSPPRRPRLQPSSSSSAARRIKQQLALRALVGFSALVQYVKLMGLRGIPWTQVAGCAYFFSYLQLEALEWIVTARQYHLLTESDDRVIRSLDRLDRVASIMQGIGWTVKTQLRIWVIFLYVKREHGIHLLLWDGQDILGLDWLEILLLFLEFAIFALLVYSLGLVWICCQAGLLLSVFKYGFGIKSCPWRLNESLVGEPFALTLVFGCGPAIILKTVISYRAVHRSVTISSEYCGAWIFAYIVLKLANLPAFVAGRLWEGYAETGSLLWGRKASYSKVTVEVFLSLVMPLFYYCVLYRPDGTVKPGWVGSLG